VILEHLRFDLKDKMIFEKVRLKPPLGIGNPMPNEACFLYVINGTHRATSEKQSFQLRSYEGVLMKCGSFLSEWIKTNESEVCEAFAVHFYPELLKEIYEREIPDFMRKVDATKKDVTMSPVKTNKTLKNYVESMQFYFDNPDLVEDELIKVKVKELLLLLIKTESGSAIQHLLSSLFTPQQFSFREIINSNLYKDLSIQQLAQLTSRSLSSFKREFGKMYGQSPAGYIRKKKLDRASYFLKSTDKRVSVIAFECGFNDLAHFSKLFQNNFGASPTKYRVEPN